MESAPFLENFARRVRYGAAFLCLMIAGTLLSPPERAAWGEARERAGALAPEALAYSAGTGVALGTLGGFRTVLADVAWLRAFHFWEKRDPVSCLKYAELSMTLAPEQTFFLENAANFVAFDFPIWEIRRRGGFLRVSENVQREIHKEAMNAALGMLAVAENSAPGVPKIPLLAAQIALMKTDRVFGASDYAAAAAHYRRACGLAGAPRFAFAAYARIAAEHLPDADRAAAKAFLEKKRGEAETPSERNFFRQLLEEYFQEPAGTPPPDCARDAAGD